MEQIVRRDNRLYYGTKPCRNIEEAYSMLREDYHRSLGTNSWGFLNRLGQRKERMHGFGFVFSKAPEKPESLDGRIYCRLLGLRGIAYCYMIALGSYADLPENEFSSLVDWLLQKGSPSLIKTGRRGDKAGRTSKRLKTRFR